MSGMETANGTLRLGDRVEVIGGQEKGKRGAIVDLKTSGVFAGLVVVEHARGQVVVEGVNVQQSWRAYHMSVNQYESDARHDPCDE